MTKKKKTPKKAVFKEKRAESGMHRREGTGKFTDEFWNFASTSTSRHGPIATQGKFKVYGTKPPTKAQKGVGASAARDPEARKYVRKVPKRGGNSVTSKSYSKAKKGK